jgi:hypothetical protein
MALSKKIEEKNGVTTNYHRIVSINQIVNNQTLIEVASYTDKSKREEEQQAYKTAKETGTFPEMNVFIDTKFINKEYAEEESVESAYDYIKTLDEFKGAKDC